MRTYRHVLIQNGLANIPAKICTVSRSSSTSNICQACPKCNGDVGHKNYCKECGLEPETADILKAFRVSKSEKIILTEEQKSQLKESEVKIEVLGTVNRNTIDSKMLALTESCYYIWQDEKAKVTKPLAILLAGLVGSDRFLAVNSTLSGKTKLGLIRPEVVDGNNVLMLQILTYLEYLNPIDENFTTKLSPEEVEMGKSFVERQLKEIDLNAIEDPYSKVIESVMSGESIVMETKQEKDELAFFKVTA